MTAFDPSSATAFEPDSSSTAEPKKTKFDPSTAVPHEEEAGKLELAGRAAAGGVVRVTGDVPFLAGGLAGAVGASDTADKLFRAYDKSREVAANIEGPAPTSIGGRVAQAVGALPGGIASLGANSLVEPAANVVKEGGDLPEAYTQLGLNTAANVAGLGIGSLGKTVAQRVIQQGAASGALNEAARVAGNLTRPSDRQQEFDPVELGINVGAGAGLGAVMRPHPNAAPGSLSDAANAVHETATPTATAAPPVEPVATETPQPAAEAAPAPANPVAAEAPAPPDTGAQPASAPQPEPIAPQSPTDAAILAQRAAPTGPLGDAAAKLPTAAEAVPVEMPESTATAASDTATAAAADAGTAGKTPDLRQTYADRQSQIDELNTKRKSGSLSEQENNTLHDLNEQQLNTNAVSGMPNRRALDQALASGEYSHAAALDIDDFKKVNDTFGHGAGDQLIQIVGQHLADTLGPDMGVFHLSGDEYAVGAKGDPTEKIKAQQAVLDQQPITVHWIDKQGREVDHTFNRIGLSFGVGEGENAYQKADIASQSDKDARKAAGLRSGERSPGRRATDLQSDNGSADTAVPVAAGSDVQGVQLPAGGDVPERPPIEPVQHAAETVAATTEKPTETPPTSGVSALENPNERAPAAGTGSDAAGRPVRAPETAADHGESQAVASEKAAPEPPQPQTDDAAKRIAELEKKSRKSYNDFEELRQLKRGEPVPAPTENARAAFRRDDGKADATQRAKRYNDVRTKVEHAKKDWGSNAPDVRVYPHPDDAPPDVVAQMKGVRPDTYGKTTGFYDGKRAYIFTDNAKDARDGLRTVAHEAIGHFGVDGIIDQHVKGGWDRLTKDIEALRNDKTRGSKALRDAIDSVERRYKNEDGSPADPSTFASELVAVMAERGIRNSFMDRVVAAVRALTRKLFPNMKFGESDIHALLRHSEDFIRSDKPGAAEQHAPNRALAFDKAEPVQTQAFRKWFGGSKAADKAGNPLELFHGTNEQFEAFDNAKLGGATQHATSQLGIHFSENKARAENYARNASEGRPADEHVIKAYLSIKRPYEMSLRDAQAIESSHQAAQFRQKLERQGFDGIRIKEAGTWIAFNPEDVKATTNRGTFNPNDKRMNFAVPEKEAKEEAKATIVDRAKAAVPNSVKEPLGNVVDDLLHKAAPMATGSDEARATAKDFANDLRLARHEGSVTDNELKSKFTRAQHERMWKAADEESVLRQRGEETKGKGLDTLDPKERAAVEALQKEADTVFQQAKELGMVEGEGLPSYVPRMVVEMAATGAQRVGKGQPSTGAGGAGGNVKTNSPNLNKRMHETTAETIAAAQKKFGENAAVVENIRTLPLSTSRLKEAIAGRRLINQIRDIGKSAGADTVREGSAPAGEPGQWFTLDHPAFQTWRPKEGSVSVKEGFDERLWNGLQKLAETLGVKHDRLASMRGKQWGNASPSGKVNTRFAGPESVLTHELGHIMDFKYGLNDMLTRKGATAKELRALADLRYEGHENEVSDNYKKYVREGSEKIANMIHAYVHMPDRFKQVAPETYKAFSAFVDAHPELKQINDIKPSLVLGTHATEVPTQEWEKVPLYVRSDFKGPLSAVMSPAKAGAIYTGLMRLKAGATSVIMYSPIIHNAVEWGRAMPAMPGKVLTFRVYFDGNRAKNDPAIMREAIKAGLAPIGGHGAFQDVTGIANEPQIQAGRSLFAKTVGALLDHTTGGGDKARELIDKSGDVWHNVLLWDRVADLQMGLYTNLRDSFVHKGMDTLSAQRMAAHMANRYAGSLPAEAMSTSARKIANLMLFSRSFTVGNLGAMKDAITGLPRDVQAQILRDSGEIMRKTAVNSARRKAIATVGMDIALMYVGNSLLQSALAIMSGRSDLDKEEQGYAQRFNKEVQALKENPLKILTFAKNVSATANNEPDRQDRVLVGHAPDGTAIYMRNPTGKIGEEFTGWLTSPLDMLKRKQGTIARPIYETITNDKGFGRKLFNPYADTPKEMLKNIGLIASNFIGDQLPTQSIAAVTNYFGGHGDATINLAQAVGPLAGITFSKGAPGGEAVGEMYAAKDQHEYQVQRALPEIRKQIQDGDITSARAAMKELDIPVGYQNWIIKTTRNPRLRLSQSQIKQFGLYATPEQKERMKQAQQAH